MNALNSTLSRTISTSLSTALVLLSIFILGGDTIRSFSFAMLLGVITGTFSTLFVAVPIAYEMMKKKFAKLVANRGCLVVKSASFIYLVPRRFPGNLFLLSEKSRIGNEIDNIMFPIRK